MEVLVVKIGTGNKYLHKVNSVEYLHKSEFRGDYWPYIHDDVAYYCDGSGYHTVEAGRIVKAEESEVVKVFGDSCYKWKKAGVAPCGLLYGS